MSQLYTLSLFCCIRLDLETEISGRAVCDSSFLEAKVAQGRSGMTSTHILLLLLLLSR